MDLRQVSYVLAVVDEGGFTRGARAAHVAQPSLSQSLQAVPTNCQISAFFAPWPRLRALVT